MNFDFKKYGYNPSPFLKAVQFTLLILIIIGIVLLITQKLWVPSLVSYIIKNDPAPALTILDAEDTPIVPSTPPKGTTTPPTPTPAPVDRPGKVDTGVEGVVTIGPTCPVVRFPDDGSCADKPYQTTLVIASTIPGKNGGMLVHTDAQGFFSQELTPGTYTISSASDVTLPRLSPVTFEVVSHKRASLNLQFDSGIR